jgi:hypothetical protein
MTVNEALWLIKVQLQRTEQNIQAIEVLEDVVKNVQQLRYDDEPTYTLDEALDEVYGTEADHLKNHMARIGKKDIKQLTGKWITVNGKKTFIANDSLDYYFDIEEE